MQGMDACRFVERELEKAISVFGSFKENVAAALPKLIQEVEDIKLSLQNANDEVYLSEEQVNSLMEIVKRVKKLTIHKDHKEAHSPVSRAVKLVDRCFISDFDVIARDDLFKTQKEMDLINKVICQHYYTVGQNEVAEVLAEEANVNTEAGIKEPFVEINNILNHLTRHDIEPALAWAVAHHDVLDFQNSPLEFKLHRFKFLELLNKGMLCQIDAVAYARLHFSKFAKKYDTEIQCLMGMLVYLPLGLKNSPYHKVEKENRLAEIRDLFIQATCEYFNIRLDSPLQSCIDAGCVAVPALLNIRHIHQNVLGIWDPNEELPIEINVGREKHYHSMFACPILRQQTTKTNPPVKLICGHIISLEALTKLTNNNKLKCPYCPTEQAPTQARYVYF